MFTMKPTTAARIMAFAGPLVLTSASAFGQTRPRSRDANDDRFANQLLDNVVEMTRAELPEATIIAYARVRRARLETDVSAADLIRLHRAGVGDRVIAYIASVAGQDDEQWQGERDPDRDEQRARDRDGAVAWDGSSGEPSDGDGGVVAYPAPSGSVYDGWYGWPYWYGYSPYDWGWGGGFVIHGGHRSHGGDHFHRGDRGDRGSVGSRGSGAFHGDASHGSGSRGSDHR